MNAFIPHSFPGNGIGNGMRNRTNLRMEKTPRDRESLILTDHGRREFVGNFLLVGNLLPSRGNQSSAILSWWVYADGQFVETRLLGSGHKIRTHLFMSNGSARYISYIGLFYRERDLGARWLHDDSRCEGTDEREQNGRNRGTLELLSLGLGARAAPLHLHLRDFIDYPSKICIICGQGLGMHSDGRI